MADKPTYEELEQRINYLEKLLKQVEIEYERAAKSLKISESHFRSLFENAAFGIVICRLIKDDNGKAIDFEHLQVNAATFKHTGFRPEQIKGKRALEIASAEDIDKILHIYARVVETGKPDGYEQYFIVYDRTLQVGAFLIEDDFFALTFIDTTERKLAEEALRQSEERFRSIFEGSLDGIGFVDIKGYFTDCNNSLLNMLGYSIDELRTMNFDNLIPEKWHRYEQEGIFPQLISEGRTETYEKEFISKDNAIFPVELTPYRYKDKLFVVVRDISKRKKAEEELLIMKTLSDQTNEVIAIKDKNFKYIFANPVCVNELFKISGDKEIINKDDFQILPKEMADKLREIDTHIFLNDKIIVTEELIGEKIFLSRKFPIKDNKNNTTYLGLIASDITERKQMEVSLQQMQKMEAVGTLAGGIAHDFNNMLGIITGNISYALSNINEKDELFEVLLDVKSGAKQAQNLTQQLLTFAKGGAPIKKTTDLNQIIRESAKFVSRGEKAICKFDLSDNLWTIEVDPGQINQTISNFVINANQAMPDGGIILIRSENTVIFDSNKSIPLPSGQYVKITVKDQGVGISKKHISKIFDPYFSTKQKGSGLGLTTSYSIIKRHGGNILVESKIEIGTTFYIYLPASEKITSQVENRQQSIQQGKYTRAKSLL